MKIVVCVKQVAYIYLPNGYDLKTGDIVSEGLIHILNPYDEVAVEEAVRQRERAGRGRVTVITLGPSRAEAALRRCLAQGADDAVHILEEGTAYIDPWTTASVLTKVITGLEYDLLLFGKMALDDEMGQVGTLVAELLSLPVVTSVTELEVLGPDRARLQRALARGNREEVLCSLPAVFTVEKSLNRPRYPGFPARKAAKKASIQQVIVPPPAPNPTGGKMEFIRLAPPKLKPKRILAPDSNMSEAEKMKFILTGGLGDKKVGSIGGDPEKIVSGIIDFLKEKKVI